MVTMHDCSSFDAYLLENLKGTRLTADFMFGAIDVLPIENSVTRVPPLLS